MIQGIHHVAIVTPNLDRLVKFYVDHLGFEIGHRTQWPKGTPAADKIVGMKDSAARMAMMRAGNCYIEVFEYSSPEGEPIKPNRPAADHGYTHFCLNVTDIHNEYERLLKAGMTFHCPPQARENPAHIATYGRDPDGNIIELLEILEDSHPFNKAKTVLGKFPTVA